MVSDAKRQTLIYWIVLIDLALERPGEAKVLRELFLLEAKGQLKDGDRDRLNDVLRKLKRQEESGPDEGVLIKNEVFEALARLEQMDVET